MQEWHTPAVVSFGLSRVISGSLVRHLYKNDGTIAVSPIIIVISYIGADVGFMSSMHVFGGRFMYPKFLGVIVIIMHVCLGLTYSLLPGVLALSWVLYFLRLYFIYSAARNVKHSLSRRVK